MKLKTIPKLEKLNHIWKFETVTDYAAIVMDKHGFDKDHNCVVAEVPVIITATKPLDMPVNYSQLLSNSSPSSTAQSKSDKELTLFSPCHNNNNKKKKNPHQNLPERSVLQTWNLEHRLNSQN